MLYRKGSTKCLETEDDLRKKIDRLREENKSLMNEVCRLNNLVTGSRWIYLHFAATIILAGILIISMIWG